MNIKGKTAKGLFAAAALTLASSNAFAGMMTVSDSFGTQGSTTDVDVGILNETLSVAGFDTSLGILTGVSIAVFGQMDSAGSSKNVSAADGRADVSILLGSDWSVTTAAADDYMFGTAGTTLASDQSSPAGNFDLSPGEIFTYDLSSGEQSGAMTGVDLSAFTTGNMVDFVFSALAMTYINNDVDSGTGTFENTFQTGSWGRVEVTYTYTSEVPEPASIAILALGLMGLSLRNKQKQV
ncbi:PEP-CTERM sorting domain-containing protein [Thalassomonas viridans]|uniref:PEP-CTERM sorting domain-containing protein n=1 Tax=Thalassomonas viridans TaxID=137584 RepID=A0AAE9Z8P6_9GAMM|nr:PEP-CTERM sorting domain-containing protein [Thalassomonas viridans]WDE08120.1 PEP-CTERM sorting domain-containing protein [Thalassomonas viridans]